MGRARGRPSTVTKDVVAKLEHAFMMDAGITQACIYAGISRDAYYRYVDKHPKFATRTKELRENNVLQAKILITEDLIRHKNVNTAKWYLEHKDSEFAQKQETKVTGSMAVLPDVSQLTTEELKKLANAQADDSDDG